MVVGGNAVYVDAHQRGVVAYSVKPVYEVFCEKVRGEAVAATVEYTPLGVIIFFQ